MRNQYKYADCPSYFTIKKMKTVPNLQLILADLRTRFGLGPFRNDLILSESPLEVFSIKEAYKSYEDYDWQKGLTNAVLLCKLVIFYYQDFEYLYTLNPNGVMNILHRYLEYFKFDNSQTNQEARKREFFTTLNILLQNNFQSELIGKWISQLELQKHSSTISDADCTDEEIQQLLANHVRDYLIKTGETSESIDIATVVRSIGDVFPLISKDRWINSALSEYYSIRPIDTLQANVLNLRKEFDLGQYLPSIVDFNPSWMSVRLKLFGSENKNLPEGGNLGNLVALDAALMNECSNNGMLNVLLGLESSLKLIDLKQTRRPLKYLKLGPISFHRVFDQLQRALQIHYNRKTVFEYLLSRNYMAYSRAVSKFQLPKEVEVSSDACLPTSQILKNELEAFLDPTISFSYPVLGLPNIYQYVEPSSYSEQTYSELTFRKAQVEDLARKYIDMDINQRVANRQNYMLSLMVAGIIPSNFSENILNLVFG
ncbi:MAG: hypothetical protein ACRCXZ_00655 [Patescibacteria group bacterium]